MGCDYEDIEHNYLAVDSTDYLCGGSVIYVNAMPSKIFFDGGYLDINVVKGKQTQRPRRTAGMTDEEYSALLQRWMQTLNRTELSYRFFTRDHLGNNRAVIDKSGTVRQKTDYYPSGTPFSTRAYTITSGFQPFKYNGKEFDMMHGLNTYDYGARQYYPLFAQWDRVDPLCEKYYHVSPYAYCGNNPINHIDMDGRETHVAINANGTYRVIGGVLNKDRNIYVYSQDDNGNYSIRGNSIGITSSTTSFYNSDKYQGRGAWEIGATINPKDYSGRTFLNRIVSESITLDEYIDKARNDHPYDFKVTNGGATVISKDDNYMYRGMSIGSTALGQTIYSSARDIGNMAAGIVAAKNGISWGAARVAFDGYQSRNGLQTEGLSTRNAEYYGWSKTYSQSNGITEATHLRNTIKSCLNKLWNKLIEK